MKKSLSFLVKPQFIFTYFFLVELGTVLYLILDMRLPLYDTFSKLSLQYYFLNHIAVYGEVPYWVPYLQQGLPAAWWMAIQGSTGVVCHALMLLPKIVADTPFLVWFYAGMLIQRLILLLGAWLWCRRLYVSRWTQVVVMAGILFPAVWIRQAYFALDLYYALPLLAFFLWQFFVRGRWRYFAAAASLYAVQTLGSLAYFIPVHSLLISAGLAAAFVLNPQVFHNAWTRLASVKRMTAAMVGAAVSLTLAYGIVKAGHDGSVMLEGGGRAVQGTVAVQDFLRYGGLTHPAKWLDSLSGVMLLDNITYYVGPVILFGLLYSLVTRKSRPEKLIWIMAALCLFLTSATIVGVWAYYWPGMKLYRHMPLLDWITRGLICFGAGFGWDRFLKEPWSRWRKVVLVTAAAGFAVIAYGAAALAQDADRVERLYEIMAGHATLPTGMDEGLGWTALLFGIHAVWLAAFMIVRKLPAARQGLLAGLLLLTLVDFVYVRMGGDLQDSSVRMTSAEASVLDYQPLPYHARRQRSLWANNPRLDLFRPDLAGIVFRSQHAVALLFHEQPDAPLGSVTAQSIGFIRSSYGPEGIGHPAALRLSGVDGDKMRFFSQAHTVDKNILRKALSSDKFEGNVLLIARASANPPVDLSGDETWAVDYMVSRFNANRVVVETGHAPAGGWLFYSDAWHPSWRATVNGKAVPVESAYGGYKSVPLEEGRNRVVFRFDAGYMPWVLRCVAIQCIAWICYILVKAARIMAGRDPSGAWHNSVHP